ncbi:MAG: hydantoinase B/oxoprolinase family protein [Gammaproteobacteria bacterium]|nr:hydantoinase B/oxoprolinase family protein [Gammaproteobacteria bacterium]
MAEGNTSLRAAAAPRVFDEARYLTDAYAPTRKSCFVRDDEHWPRIEALKNTIDSVTLDVLEWALEAAIDEGEAAVERTAVSTIVREQHDYRASLNTIDCNSVTRVSWAATADPIRNYYPLDEIHEGDVFLYNDIHESSGTIGHLPDFCVVVPIFSDARLIAFAQLFGHCNDVGGKMSGSWSLTATTVFEEGIQVPPIKLYARGVRNEDVWKVILRNSRYPDDLRGDIDAFVGATRIIQRRVVELCKRYGTDVVEAGFYRIMDRCEEIVREDALPHIPNGEYVGEDFLETDGIDLDKPVKLMLTVRKDPEKIIVDFAGTDPQTAGPVNWVMDGRHYSKWLGGFVKAQVPGMIVNEGMTRVFKTYLPPRTVLSAEYPAAGADRMDCMLRMLGAYMAAMAKATNGQMVGDSQCIQLYGFFGKGKDGKDFLYREIFGAGSGARPFADGTDTVDLVPHSKNLPSEFIEQRFPVLVHRVGMFPDSGGPGAFRGGLGYLKDVEILVDGHFLTVSYRTIFSCFGVNGGMAGRSGGAVVNPDTPQARQIWFKREAVPVQAGDVVRILTPGGGGWGDPLARVPEMVRLDVQRGLVSVSSARDDYGVVLREVSDLNRRYEADTAATDDLRAKMKSVRPPLKMINRGPHAEKLIREGVITVSDFDYPAQFDEASYLAVAAGAA